ncbi:hypothetical protein [Pontibaca methylaminivorans]|uniref:YARHG domain-containing protein n=1 Tax=Pontibaca methylaminivorans TaxID=515897 RepID=A0A1R3X1V3_9RHOB|nr:hypothetical protein [Pontibaca methylaminivorans]SIT84944.1 hypothetical protein SAMN05421849_2217 [Pontibaca methylaminivorans]
MITKIIACSLCMIMFSVSSTLAQQAADGTIGPDADERPTAIEIDNPSYDALPLETRQEIMTEAQYVQDSCARNSLYSSFIDCRCLAEKFADTRTGHKALPEEEQEELRVSKLNLMHFAEKRQTECVNEPGIAEYARNQCQDYVIMMPEAEGQEFCECYASTFVENFSERPKLITPVLQQAGTKALLSCDDGTGPIKGDVFR